MKDKIHVGVAGWSYPDWRGRVYPRRPGGGFDPLSYLSEYIDVIEINSTYYHPGSPERARQWGERVKGKEFRFTVKLWSQLTHERGREGEERARQARAVPEVLAEGECLAGVLAQFPWSFRNRPENREWITQLRSWFREFPFAVEVRHSSWAGPETEEFFRKLEVAWVNIDQPAVEEALSPGEAVSASFSYVRFHGRNRESWFREEAGRDERYDYLYELAELVDWAERIRSLGRRCEHVYVIFNNHYQGQALVNALQLKALLGGDVLVPEMLDDVYPGFLSSLPCRRRPGGQGRLFE